jgi:thioesterase domain-containing protein
MAQRLRARGERVALLALVNAPSPDYIRRRQGRLMRRPLAAPASAAPAQSGPQEQDKKATSLLRRVQVAVRWRLTSLRLRFGPACRALWMPLHRKLRLPVPAFMRTHFFLHLTQRAELAYRPEPYAGPLVLFRAADLYFEPDLGWGSLAGAGLEIHEFSGDFQDQRGMGEPCVRAVADRLNEILSQTRHSPAPPVEAARPEGSEQPHLQLEGTAWNG